MKNIGEHKFVVGLEVGTSKVVAVVGQLFADGAVEIIGFGNVPSNGIDKGVVTDLNALKEVIQRALDDASNMSQCEIESVVLAISGQDIHSLNESGTVIINDEEGVTKDDVMQAMNTARSVKMGDGVTLLQVVPQEYALDERMNITDPLGLQGIRLTAQAHLITCQQVTLANLKKAVSMCSSQESKMPIKVEQVFYSGFASAQSVLTEDEKQLGVCLADIGAGTIDLSIYTQGKLRLSKSLTYAGNTITRDICQRFNVPFSEAENAKITHGSATYYNKSQKNFNLSLKSSAPDCLINCSNETFYDTTASRCHELVRLIAESYAEMAKTLKKQNMSYELAAGFVITGGTAQMKNIQQCAENYLGKYPVRIGIPLNISGLTDYVEKPTYATVIGLLHCCHTDMLYRLNDEQDDENLWRKVGFNVKKLINKLRAEF